MNFVIISCRALRLQRLSGGSSRAAAKPLILRSRLCLQPLPFPPYFQSACGRCLLKIC